MIKKNKNKNNYIVQDGIYIRDFTIQNVPYVDLNNIFENQDYDLCMENELENITCKYPTIDNENFVHKKILIISDGYGFEKKQNMLANLPKDVAIIAINGSLKKWNLIQRLSGIGRSINYYVINNPYQESMNYLPEVHQYYPKCIASIRTNSKFLKKYNGIKYLYSPTINEKFSGIGIKCDYYIDDYRSPICAALGLAFRFFATKIMLFCCDDSFEDNRPGSVRLDNGLYCYPQQNISKNIIDANCHWFKKEKISVTDSSSAGKYSNIAYIKSEEQKILEYFNE